MPEPNISEADARWQKEIDELVDPSSAGQGDAFAPPPEPASVAPAEPAPAEPAPVVEPVPVEPAPVIQPPAEPAPVAPTAEQKFATLEATINKLQDTIQALASRPVAPQQVVEPPKPVETKYDVQDFVDEAGFGKAMESKEGLNAVLNRVAELAYKKARADVEATIPATIAPGVVEAIRVYNSTEKFYAENKHLEKIRPFVGTIFQEIRTKYPNLSYEELLFGDGSSHKGLSSVVNEKLGIDPQRLSQPPANPKGTTPPATPPPAAPGTGTRPANPVAKKRTMQDDINETLGIN